MAWFRVETGFQVCVADKKITGSYEERLMRRDGWRPGKDAGDGGRGSHEMDERLASEKRLGLCVRGFLSHGLCSGRMGECVFFGERWGKMVPSLIGGCTIRFLHNGCGLANGSVPDGE